MNRTSPRPSHPLDPRSAYASLFGSFVEWEELPPPAPFVEPIRGLHVREIDASDVFSHFFGRGLASH